MRLAAAFPSGTTLADGIQILALCVALSRSKKKMIDSTLVMLADFGCWVLWSCPGGYKVRFSKIGRSPLGHQTGFSPEQDRQGGIASVHSTQRLLTSASRLVAKISRPCVSLAARGLVNSVLQH